MAGSFRLQAEGPLLAAAAITGVAFSTHYYAIFLAIPLAWSAARGARDRGDAVRRIAIAAAVSGAVFFLLSPFILVEPGTALRDIRANRQIVVDRAVENLGYAAERGALRRAAAVRHRRTARGAARARRARRSASAATRRARSGCSRFRSRSCCSSRARSGEPLPGPARAVPGPVRRRSRSRRSGGSSGWSPSCSFAAAFAMAGLESLRTDAFIRQTDTRTLALDFIRVAHPRRAPRS